MRVQTWDKKVFDVPEENLEGFLRDYNKATNFDPATLSSDPEINPERGANWGGVVRAGLQGVPVVGSYSDEAEASVRAAGDALLQEMMYQQEHRNDPKPEPQFPGLAGQLIQGVQNFQDTQKRYSEAYDKSYDKYLKNARDSFEGALKNSSWGYPAYIGTGLLGEGALAYISGGATLHPTVQGLMGAAYGYGMGENIPSRLADAALVGGASYALPAFGKYAVKGTKAGVDKIVNYGIRKLEKDYPLMTSLLKKIPTEEKAVLRTVAETPNGTVYKNVNIISSLVDGATKESEKTQLAKEISTAARKAGISENPQIQKDAAAIIDTTWKTQSLDAVDDVLLTKEISKADEKALETISKLIQAAPDDATIDSIIKSYGKNLSEKSMKELERQVSNAKAARQISESIIKSTAQKEGSNIAETIGGGLLGSLVGSFGGPIGGLIGAGVGALSGGGLSGAVKAVVKNAADKSVEKVSSKLIKDAKIFAAKAAKEAAKKTSTDSVIENILRTHRKVTITPEVVSGYAKKEVVKKPSWLKTKALPYIGRQTEYLLQRASQPAIVRPIVNKLPIE